MTHRLINLALFIGLVITLSYVGPALDDNSAEHEVAREELAKQNREERFATAAREICGQNAGWTVTQGNVLVCKTKRNKSTGQKVQL